MWFEKGIRQRAKCLFLRRQCGSSSIHHWWNDQVWVHSFLRQCPIFAPRWTKAFLWGWGVAEIRPKTKPPESAAFGVFWSLVVQKPWEKHLECVCAWWRKWTLTPILQPDGVPANCPWISEEFQYTGFSVNTMVGTCPEMSFAFNSLLWRNWLVWILSGAKRPCTATGCPACLGGVYRIQNSGPSANLAFSEL